MSAQSSTWTRLLGALMVLSAGACGGGASDDPALGARMRVAGAQFVAGATPLAQGGPAVAQVDLLSTTIWPGYANKPIQGVLTSSGTAVTLALSGDQGYWVVPAGVPGFTAPDLPTFRASASFSQELSVGHYTLEARAVDVTGQFGPPRRQTLTALPIAPSVAVAGTLTVTLTWDTEADLDLHVVDPSGTEIFHGARSSVDPFSSDATGTSVGVLDVDSNAQCVIDGLRQEDVVWADEPPSGHYLVRVDTTSLCDRTSARWTVRVTLNEAVLASAAGLSLDSDTRGSHDRGAGLLALGFDVP
ncbi:MAG: hypothetical protein ABI488_04665 [Polyangiaceae bacterium]